MGLNWPQSSQRANKDHNGLVFLYRRGFTIIVSAVVWLCVVRNNLFLNNLEKREGDAIEEVNPPATRLHASGEHDVLCM